MMSSIQPNLTITVTPSLNGNIVESARAYQTELMAQAKLENLIVCLPTGSGKTYIAVMLIKEMSQSIRMSLKQGGKRTVFLVKTVQLVEQQSDYVRRHTDLSIGKYYGDLGVDWWENDRWKTELEQHQVLFFTAQVFLNILDHNYFSLDQVNLIIFDECHHASGDDHYAALMNKHYDQCVAPPRVLGLTASLSAKKIQPKDIISRARHLEGIFRARIESGSNPNESIHFGTSVQVETLPCPSYREKILNHHESLSIPFEILRFMINQLQNTIASKKYDYDHLEAQLSQTMLMTNYREENVTTYNSQSGEFTALLLTKTLTLPNIRRDLDNLIEIGYELGLLGFYIFAKNLNEKFQQNSMNLRIIDNKTRISFDDCLSRLNCLVEDILTNLCRIYGANLDVMLSPKVHQLIERMIQKGNDGKTIIFVERIYTAKILAEVLRGLVRTLPTPWNTRLKIGYVTGVQTTLGKSNMAVRHQREVIRKFRSSEINVLVATAVVEEGLDIPHCDLVIRFNKPKNFSSYMQSKGRARAKQNASYVLFIDESNADALEQDKKEYRCYEEIEQMIKKGFSTDSDENFSVDDLSEIPPYRPSPGVVIDATRAAQLIMEYCVLLGNGQLFPPRFIFHGVTAPFTCILSMPANCPIRDDIFSKRNRKKTAKYECCLKMVELLHKEGEFNEHCLPNRNRLIGEIPVPIENQIFRLVDQLFDERNDGHFETISKKLNIFPVVKSQMPIDWHLYRLDNHLGFLIPMSTLEIPKFILYGTNETFEIDVRYVKSIVLSSCRCELEEFTRYIFEDVFDQMHTNEYFRFDLERSPIKCLICLLTDSNEIDSKRMSQICQRKTRMIHQHSELSTDELYQSCHLPDRQFFTFLSDIQLRKCFTGQFKNGTFADYFISTRPDISFRRDEFLATLKGIRQPRINYLTSDFSTNEKDKIDTKDPIYLPIEYLRYAPLNKNDWKIIYRLPSLLVRIVQLYRIEKLRKRLVKCSLIKAKDMATVTFRSTIESSGHLLPLIRLNYDRKISSLQPTSHLLLQSVTRRSADEQFDMENLEILGDCFLKLSVSMCLYYRYPRAGAGALTVAKTKQISNENLFRLIIRNDLREFLYPSKVFFRGDQANWIPPGYFLSKIDEKQYTTETVKRKAFADMFEAMIGVYLISTNYSTTLEWMKTMGLDVIPLDDQDKLINLSTIYSTSIRSEEIEKTIDIFYQNEQLDQIEQILRYRFRTRAYLIAALTHPSSFTNRLTNCYERLEFLGDAVLDFLVTRDIFYRNENITPGRVTDIRQDLSNNGRLAYFLVALGFHKKILHNSPELFGKISAYIADEELFPDDASPETLLNKDIDQWADSTAPKVLADVFEAIVGAIFLDSDQCLETVWKCFEPVLRNYIVKSISNPNLNPIRTFTESGGKILLECSEWDVKQHRNVSICRLVTENGQEIEERAENKRKAKYLACQRAMKQMKVRRSSDDFVFFSNKTGQT